MHCVSETPRPDVADTEANQQLVVVERNVDESLLEVVSCHVLSRHCVLVAGLRSRLAGLVATQAHSTVAELVEGHLMLRFGLTDSARVLLQQEKVLRAGPAVVFGGTVAGTHMGSTYR